MTETSPFVGRQAELEALFSILKEASTGRGKMVFIEGGVGMGKSLLLETLENSVRQIKKLETTPFASSTCEETGSQIRQNISQAVEYSTFAVQYLKRVGIMPALRIEEIYYNHFKVLKAAGHEIEAQNFCKEAASIIRQKAESIREPSYRETFLARVPLNKAVLEDFGS